MRISACSDNSIVSPCRPLPQGRLQTVSQRGFSLVEMMVATVLGLLLIGGSISIFQGNLRTARLGQAISGMQANARFALDEIAADVRAAGFRGCASGAAPMMVSTNVAPVDANAPASSALVGTTVAAGGLSRVDMLNYQPPTDRGAPVTGTDVLLVQFAEAPGETMLETMSSPTDSIDIDGDMAQLENGDLAMIADCSGSEVFRIDTRSSAMLRTSLQPEASLAREYSVDPYGFGVHVFPFTSAMYYIGDTGRETRDGAEVHALYVQNWPYTPDTNPPLELAEGVEQLRLTFGMRNDTTEQVRFVRADDAAFNPLLVTSVRIGLLMSSNDTFDAGSAPREFSLAGQAVVAAGSSGAAFYPNDDRLRMPFERTVAVRNRGLGERVE